MQKVVEGLLINYEIVGRGKQDLVIMHGWGGSYMEWLPIAEELKDRYRIILFDFPGLGGSVQPHEDWGIYDYAQFTSNFLQSLKVKKAVVMGHSFGGRVAILLGSRYPVLLRQLVLVDAAGMEIKSWRARLFGSSFLLPLRWIKYVIPESFRQKLRSRDYQKAGPMRNIFVKVVAQNLREELAKIVAPTLIVWGSRDHVLSLAEARMLKQGIQGSRLRIVWGASHWPHREKPKDLLRILEEERL